MSRAERKARGLEKINVYAVQIRSEASQLAQEEGMTQSKFAEGVANKRACYEERKPQEKNLIQAAMASISAELAAMEQKLPKTVPAKPPKGK